LKKKKKVPTAKKSVPLQEIEPSSNEPVIYGLKEAKLLQM